MNVGQWLEDEASIRQPGVGQGENVLIHDEVVEVKNVKIDGPGGVANSRRSSAKLPLDSLGCFEEIVWLADEVDLDYRIVEVG